jgi:enamine deaminase RidA (YjgF/YER057c/UK114 family)
MDIIHQTLKAAGAGPEHVVRLRIWIKDPQDAGPTVKFRAKWPTMQPSTSQLAIQGFLQPHWRVEIEAEADLNPDRQRLMHFLDSHGQESVGRSRGVRVGNRVLVSTTAPRWPQADGSPPVGPGYFDPDPYAQTKRCWEIVEGTLNEGGATVEHVTRVRFFVWHPDDVAIVARLYRDVFTGENKPAVCIVPAMYFSPDWRVELDADAIL